MTAEELAGLNAKYNTLEASVRIYNNNADFVCIRVLHSAFLVEISF